MEERAGSTDERRQRRIRVRSQEHVRLERRRFRARALEQHPVHAGGSDNLHTLDLPWRRRCTGGDQDWVDGPGRAVRVVGAQIARDQLKILATYAPMTNHQVYVAVEADDANAVREFTFQGRLSQWNTVEIYQTSTLEEALTRIQELPTIY